MEGKRLALSPMVRKDLIIPQDLALNRNFLLFSWKTQIGKVNKFLALVCGLGERCPLGEEIRNISHPGNTPTPLFGAI